MKYSWDKIKLENYAAIDAMRRAEASDETQKWVTLLSLASDKPEAYFEELDFVTLYKEIDELKDFLNIEIQEKLYPTFLCGGRRFKLTCLTEEEIKGKHIEAISLLKITPDTIAENCHKIMAAVTEETFTFRKKLTFQQKADLFYKQLPASIGMGVCLFFWEVLNELQPAILDSLEKQTKELVNQMKS